MSRYTVITGDTFAAISRKVYGVETSAGLIQRANPGVAEPLTGGIEIFIPINPDDVTDQPQSIPSDNIDEVALKIDNQRFRFWDSITITRSLDTFDTVTFSAPFNEDDKAARVAFQPFTYKPVDVMFGGAPLFTGVMVDPLPSLDPNKRTVSVSCYSLPGVLNDCPIPASAFPLEYDGQGLRDIAISVARTFGLSVEFTEQQGPVFERVAADPTKKAFTFLSELARQRNFVIASTPEGKLFFRRSVTPGSPVARLAQGSPPVGAIEPQFSPQEYYSHVTGLDAAVLGLGGSQYTVENTRLKGVIRPLTFKAPDTTNGDIKAAVEAKAGRMFANMVSYSVPVATWRDPQGDLWTPNTTVKLVAPGAMIYNEYEFIIRSVGLIAEKNSRSAVLELVLPGAFDGKIPEALPWDL